jgi:chromosome segregation ATPase
MAKRKKLQSNVKEQPNSSTGLVISNNNLFVEKMDSLKEFSGQLPKITDLPTVPTEGGLFGWFNHNVTGDEINNLTENIQDRMIEQNKTLLQVFQEIAAVYDTFSALDNVYVQEILIAINTAFEAIDEVRAANERISEQQKDISGAQKDIKQVIDQQKQIIQVLKNFKEKLEKLKHLYDIDKIYSSSQDFQTKIETLEQTTADQRVNIEKVSETQTRSLESLKSLSDSNNIFSEKIQKLSETLGEHKKLSSDLEKAVEQCKKDQIGTSKEIEIIKNVQENFEKSLEDQKTSIERLSATQKEYAISLSKAKEAGDILSDKFAQSVQETGQRFSEIEQASNNADKKYESVQSELTALRNENDALSKSLIMAKGISIASLALSYLLFILFLTGVLR